MGKSGGRFFTQTTDDDEEEEEEEEKVQHSTCIVEFILFKLFEV